jgi:hypothetical protein
MNINLRLLYLYLFSAVGLIIVVFGSIQLVNLGLKTFVFRQADVYEIYPGPKGEADAISPEEQIARQRREQSRQRQRELANAISAISIGLPLYLYHWNTIQRESKKKLG